MDEYPLSPDLQYELSILDNSQKNILLIIAALAIQYKSLDVQRDKLLCSTLCPENFDESCFPDTRKTQLLASSMTLLSLLGFYDQSKDIAQRAAQAGNCDPKLQRDVLLSAIVALVSMVRIFQQAQNNNTSMQAPSQP